MINNIQNKLGAREIFAIIFFTLGIQAADMTPVFVFRAAKNAGWIMVLVASIIPFISFLAMIKLFSRYKNKGLIDIIYHLTGNFIGFIISIMLTIQIILFTALNTRIYSSLLATVFFNKTPIAALYLILVGASLSIAILGLEAIGRVSWITLPYIGAMLVVYIMLVSRDLNPLYLFPILGSGAKELIKKGLSSSTIYGEIVYFAVLFPLVKNFKEYKTANILGLATVTVEISLFCAVYVMAFDYPPVVIINYPFQSLARLIYVGRFIGNLEAFFLIFWVIGAVIRYSIYFYVDAAYLSYTLKLKRVQSLILPCAVLSLIVGMIPENYTVVNLIIKPILLKVSLLTIYPLPFILLIISQFKGDYKNEVQKN